MCLRIIEVLQKHTIFTEKSYNLNFTNNESSNPVNDFLNHVRTTIPQSQQRELEQKFTLAITYISQLTEAHNALPSQSTTALLNNTRGILNAHHRLTGNSQLSIEEDKHKKNQQDWTIQSMITYRKIFH